MKQGVYLFQEPNIVYSLVGILKNRTNLNVKGSHLMDEAEKDILSGEFSKIIVEPYIGCKKGDPIKLQEILQNAVKEGINVLVYSTLSQHDIGNDCGIVEGVHYNHYRIMPAELQYIVDYVQS